PCAQQDAFFKDSWFNVRMANGAQQNGWELPQFAENAVRQNLIGAQVAIAADVVVAVVELEVKLFGRDIEDLDRLTDDLGSGTVGGDYRNVVAFHESMVPLTPALVAGIGDANVSVAAGNGILLGWKWQNHLNLYTLFMIQKL